MFLKILKIKTFKASVYHLAMFPLMSYRFIAGSSPIRSRFVAIKSSSGNTRFFLLEHGMAYKNEI